MTTTRAKFRCLGVRKQLGYQKDVPFTFETDFTAVTSGSEENKAFFASTPTGTIKVSTVREDHFKVGQDYYVDFTEANVPSGVA